MRVAVRANDWTIVEIEQVKGELLVRKVESDVQHQSFRGKWGSPAEESMTLLRVFITCPQDKFTPWSGDSVIKNI
jgi:hypothetical protein